MKLSLMAICSLMFHTFLVQAYTTVDELLERTLYAELINELICLTDSLVLLEHPKTDRHEKRFIEDSILGKLMRAHIYLNKLNCAEMSEQDITYLQSWIDLAQRSTTQSILLEEFDRFAQRLHI